MAPWLCEVANVGYELAAVRAARVVQVAERHLDGFGARLPVFSRRAGQLHHEADGDRALVRARRAAERERKNRRRDKSRASSFSVFLSNALEPVSISRQAADAVKLAPR